ncbi:hypothetical protein [Peribacillus frigoritolerans]|uniref:hypothetical protein n=1 Tax=Peribacillus frigoritolerans TaxID=450367 RepID=UPI0037FCDC88
MKDLKAHMSNVLFFKRGMLKCHCVWDKDWISEYESPWSLFEKFRYFNSVSSLDFVKYFGNKKNSKNIYNNIDIYELDYYFDKEKLNSEYCFNIIKYNQDNLIEISKEAFNKKNFKNYLWICPLCIQKGYHSIFNQYKFIHNCPFHNVPLVVSCPNCHLKRKYILQTKEGNAPFKCICGFNYLKIDSSLTLWPIVKTNRIKSKPLLKWMSCNDLKINNFIFSDVDYIPIGKIDSELQFKHNISELMKYNNCLPDGYNEENLKISCKGKSQFTTQQLQDKRIEFLGISRYVKFFNSNYTKMQETTGRETLEDYLEARAKTLFISIARRIRKTLLKKHKTCLNYILNNNDNPSTKKVCPLAYAYLLWRKKSQKLQLIKDLNRPKPRGMYRLHHGLFPVINNYNFILEEIIRDWRFKHSIIDSPTHSHEWENLGWIISKVLELMYLSDFNKCICVINQCISNSCTIEESMLNLDEPILYPSIILGSSNEAYDNLKICYKGKHNKISSYREFLCHHKNL